jgi:hypothetical protein
MKKLANSRIGWDLSGPFTSKVRKRKKGDRRIGTKPKKILSAMERTFQEELKLIRAIGPAELPSERSLPRPQIFKPKKKPGLLDKVKAKLHRHGAQQDG